MTWEEFLKLAKLNAKNGCLTITEDEIFKIWSFLSDFPEALEMIMQKLRAEVLEMNDCPYCGASGLGLVYVVTNGEDFWGYCDGCGMQGPIKDTKEEAMKAWNSLSEIIKHD